MKNVLVALLLLGLVASGASAENRIEEKTCEARPDGHVDVSNVAGSVTVSAWEKNEVYVHAELEENVKRLDVSCLAGRIKIKVESERPGVKIRARRGYFAVRKGGRGS